jgi:hypothetical protein
VARAPRRRKAKQVLDRAEARAKERLASNARALQEDLEAALKDGGVIRQHPYVAMAAAASLGAVAVPLLLRFLRSPGPALRSAGRLARVMGFRSWLAGSSLLADQHDVPLDP